MHSIFYFILIVYKMPKRRKQRKRRAVQGDGFFQDLGRALKKGVRFARKHKVISRAASVASKLGVPHAGTVGRVAKIAGFGKGGRGRSGGARRHKAIRV